MRFRNRGLAALDRILQFVGGQVLVDDLDMGGQIQPVFDVSKLAGLSSIQTDPQAAGYFQIGQDNAHAGVGDTVVSSVGVYTQPPLSATWGRAAERWVWLIWYSIQSDIATTSIQLSLGLNALGQAFANRDLLIADWQSATVTINNKFGTLNFASTAKREEIRTPLLMPPDAGDALTGSTLQFRSVSGGAAGAGTIRLSTICWVGPTGVYPPGL